MKGWYGQRVVYWIVIGSYMNNCIDLLFGDDVFDLWIMVEIDYVMFSEFGLMSCVVVYLCWFLLLYLIFYMGLLIVLILLFLCGIVLYEGCIDVCDCLCSMQQNFVLMVLWDIECNIEIYLLLLQVVVEGVNDFDVIKLLMLLCCQVLFDCVMMVKYFGGIYVFDVKGDIVVDGKSDVLCKVNFVNELYFIVFCDYFEIGLYVSFLYYLWLCGGLLSIVFSW